MPYTPAPPAPARNRPQTFADEGDAFLAWLPPFGEFCEEVRITAENAIAASAVSVTSSGVAVAASNYKGKWASLSGPLDKPACVWHANAFWVLEANLPNVAAAEPGVSAHWTSIQQGIDTYPYANRAALRATAPLAGDMAVVEGLGLFTWAPGNTTPDDDETCFAALGGRWLLAAASPQYIAAAQEGALSDLDDLADDVAAALAVADGVSARILRGTFTMSLTSLASLSSASFTCTVPGAAAGDAVIVTPGDSFGTSSADQARLACVAWVSAPGSVTVSVRNASASTAALSASTWAVTVIKQ